MLKIKELAFLWGAQTEYLHKDNGLLEAISFHSLEERFPS
jgi:16S rRNA C1402 N4-methylase RsmH